MVLYSGTAQLRERSHAGWHRSIRLVGTSLPRKWLQLWFSMSNHYVPPINYFVCVCLAPAGALDQPFPLRRFMRRRMRASGIESLARRTGKNFSLSRGAGELPKRVSQCA